MIPIAFFLTLVFLFSLARKRMATTIITGPMIFTAAGILIVLAYPPVLEQFPDFAALMTFLKCIWIAHPFIYAPWIFNPIKCCPMLYVRAM